MFLDRKRVGLRREPWEMLALTLWVSEGWSLMMNDLIIMKTLTEMP